MRCLISETQNPYLNLATEEYFLKNSSEELFMLYINEPCIVVGKHQNLLSEINVPYIYKNNIKLARRITGGGTVYQDLNNLNFSFIHNCTNLDQMNFNKFTYPILKSLREMGIPAEFSGRNDLLLESKKISGNAMHIYKNRVLSHGTLLFNTDLNILSDALKNHPEKYIDKSIKSVKSKVANISEYIKHSTSLEKFSQILFEKIFVGSENSHIKSLNESEKKAINLISKEKFETWDWIYGYSPKYEFINSLCLVDGTIMFQLKVEKGIIKSFELSLSNNNYLKMEEVFELLINVKHDYQIILDLLKINKTSKLNHDFDPISFCTKLF
jgi:lipoate-protein ligase A